MFLTLRILFTVLSAICVACVFPIGIFFGWGWAGLSAFVAMLFFILMKLCKTQQELNDLAKDKQPNSNADFLHPVTKDTKDE